MKLSIIGGTGPQGKGLALRFAQAGFEVALGSRDESRARYFQYLGQVTTIHFLKSKTC